MPETSEPTASIHALLTSLSQALSGGEAARAAFQWLAGKAAVHGGAVAYLDSQEGTVRWLEGLEMRTDWPAAISRERLLELHRDACVNYGTSVLINISLSAPAGSRIALVPLSPTHSDFCGLLVLAIDGAAPLSATAQAKVCAAGIALGLALGRIETIRRADERVQKAQRMEAVGMLAAGSIHDLNNYLMMIAGRAQLSTRHPGSVAETMRAFDQISETCDRATALARQLLDLARESVKLPGLSDLNVIAHSISEMARGALGKRIQIQKAIWPEPLEIQANNRDLEQVLMNLCLNARDAMPEGGTLTICTEPVELTEEYCRMRPGTRPGRYALLAVKDTGHGIDAALQSQIFRPLFTTKAQGSGLGLMVVNRIVTSHGGFMMIASVPNQGTTMRALFPVTNEGYHRARRLAGSGEYRAVSQPNQ